MKKLLAKLRTKSFWVTLAGALTLMLARYVGISESAGKIAEIAASLALLFGVAAAPCAAQSEEDAEGDDSNGESPEE